MEEQPEWYRGNSPLSLHLLITPGNPSQQIAVWLLQRRHRGYWCP